MTTIGTHSGVFHADDVLATAVLLLLHPDADVVRTRDPGVLATCQFVVDVGGVHDPLRGRFDHHQKGRAGVRPLGTPGGGIYYSSFGLVWAWCGLDLCWEKVGGRSGSDRSASVEEVARAHAVHAAFDLLAVAPIDATDNGQALEEGGLRLFKGVEELPLAVVLDAFNPPWDEDDFDARFMEAVRFAQAFICQGLRRLRANERARAFVRTEVATAPDPRVLVLDGYLPWEDVLDHAGPTQFLVFPDATGTWLVHTVPIAKGSFTPKKVLPEAWAGLRDEALQAVTGVRDAVFCHNARFVGGAKTKAGALALLKLALG